uniref:Uncharacterized protein n=1 Tax=Anguilla anguilla TaxID=7936 RepID=A0A0E9V328_ANGAN
MGSSDSHRQMDKHPVERTDVLPVRPLQSLTKTGSTSVFLRVNIPQALHILFVFNTKYLCMCAFPTRAN